MRVFHHNDLEKLASHLQWANQVRTQGTRVLVVTESVFSMDGDTAPLREIVQLKNEAEALLLVDEAHALGVLGRDGRGWAEELGVSAQVDFHLGTLSKAVGLSGGYICAAQDWIDLLVNKARSFIYSTAPPPAVAATAAYVLREIFPSAQGRALRERLWDHLRMISAALPELFPQPQCAILPLVLGSEDAALAASQYLLENGFLIPAIRYPTVARGAARLRITLSAGHQSDDISALVAALAGITSEAPAVPQRIG